MSSLTSAERINLFWASQDDAFHTAETICAVTELSSSTLANWRSQGKGPAFFKSGNMVYYRKLDVLNWFKSFQASLAQAA